MIGDDDFFMQNADYHYGASDTEKMYGRGYDDYNRNLWRDGLLMKPPTLEEQKRNEKNKDGTVLGLVIVGGGGFIVSMIFIMLLPYFGYVAFFGFIISLIILVIIFIIMYRDNNRMIDEIYDKPYNNNSDVNSNKLDENDKIFERRNKVPEEIEHGEYIKCPHCGRSINPIAIIFQEKCTYCGKYISPTYLYNQKNESDVSNNYKKKTTKWKKCPNCGHKLNSVAKKCPYCSHIFINHTSKSSEKLIKKSKREPKRELKKEFIKCPHCGKNINPIAIDIHKKCTHCGKYISPTSIDNLKKRSNVSNNSKNNTSKSSGNFMDFMQFQYEMDMMDLDFQHEMDMMDLDFQHEMDMMDLDFYD